MFTPPAQRHAVDKRATDDVVPRDRFRKSDGLADQVFDPCPSRQRRDTAHGFVTKSSIPSGSGG